jgi:transposase
MRVASAIELDEAQRVELMKLVHSNTTQVRLARRAGIVLLAADGLDNRTIAGLVGVGRIQVGRWRERYAAGGLKAIEQDLPRGGRKPKVDPAEIVRLTTQTKPRGCTQWERGRWRRWG